MNASIILWIIFLPTYSKAIKTYIFNDTNIDIADDIVYSGRLESAGGISSRETIATIATGWFNADKLMFYFEQLNISGSRGHCSDSYLQIFDGRERTLSVAGLEDKICGDELIKGTFASTSNTLVIKHVTLSGQSDHWSIIFTGFHEGHCKSYEYRCNNGRCISHSLRCHGNDPCGDGSDCLMTHGAMAAIALGGACAAGSVASVVFVIYKNRKRLSRRHKRQPHTFTPAHSLENLTAADYCQESMTSLSCPTQKC